MPEILLRDYIGDEPYVGEISAPDFAAHDLPQNPGESNAWALEWKVDKDTTAKDIVYPTDQAADALQLLKSSGSFLGEIYVEDGKVIVDVVSEPHGEEE